MDPDSRKLETLEVRERIRRMVIGAGFDRVGFAKAQQARGAERLRGWIDRGFAGTMSYMERSLERRLDPTLIVEGARTVIAVALHHDPPQERPDEKAEEGLAAIASYARGTDYHRVMESRLRTACESLKKAYPATYRYYVDTGPLLERDWAEEAGIGWIGKNTCAIEPTRGSFFFLGEILTTLALEPDSPATNHCGTCRLCLDACPTGALVAPYELDSRLCISYLTIEHRGPLGEEMERETGNMVFGCDICQEVCPFNRREASRAGGSSGEKGDADLAPRDENRFPSLEELAALDEEGFRRRFARSAVRRAKFEGFLRNVIIAVGNSGSAELAGLLDGLARREDIRRNPTLLSTLKRARLRLMSAEKK